MEPIIAAEKAFPLQNSKNDSKDHIQGEEQPYHFHD